MSIQGAIHFLKAVDRLGLRTDLYACDTESDIYSCLRDNGFEFDGGEFEEAVNVMHVKCQISEEADDLMNRANWFRMMVANA
jgi:hypothetical protein